MYLRGQHQKSENGYFYFWYSGYLYQCVYKGIIGTSFAGLGGTNPFLASGLRLKFGEAEICLAGPIEPTISPEEFMTRYETGEFWK